MSSLLPPCSQKALDTKFFHSPRDGLRLQGFDYQELKNGHRACSRHGSVGLRRRGDTAHTCVFHD
jgi:hypothetical protein